MLHAARRAGAMALDMQSSVTRWDKSPDHPVTEGDLAVDALLKELLLSHRPEYAWLSEETADNPARLRSRMVWVVDPIDGTRDYARGRDGWCISIALVRDGQPVAAVLHAPAQDRTYAAQLGDGATLNSAPIRVSGRASPDGMRIPLEPQALSSRLWSPPWNAVSVSKPNSMALRVALVASSEADAAFDGRTTSEWDMAAATLILEQAGGLITDRHGKRFAFNKPAPVMPGLIAATPALHIHTLERLTEARRMMNQAGIRTER